ncbi:hypothetical protein RUM43_014472 [Polyplax serrata]|uniref:C3H1-type domain-containing protein n=1 Tax=Polyplax serrata TaxID=468196 RepID=A0AAN8NVL4_POLSC
MFDLTSFERIINKANNVVLTCSQEEEDLEDGEIASDEEETSDNHVNTKEEIPEEKKPDSAVGLSQSKQAAKPVIQQTEDNDFEKDLQKLKEDVERKKNRKDAKKRRENDRLVKRRKRRASDEGKNRKEKKRKVESGKGEEKAEDDVDEDEMLGLCIRGASPTLNLDQIEVWSGKQPIIDPNWQLNENSENESDFDDRDDRKRRRREKDRRGFKGISREDREIKKRLQMKRKGKSRKNMDNSDMICINFMKGNCNKGNDCFYSHAVCPPKKMELCKFYLMDCCAKRDKCLYLHEEFPCKFFHTGLKCYSGKKCKFSHDPLNSLSKDILLKHLETAPKEILGDFPRLSRDCAETMVNNKTTGKPADTSKIPSLFDIQVSIPPEFQNAGDNNEERTTPPCSPPPNMKASPKTKSKDGLKFYEADSDENMRDRTSGSPMDFGKELEAYKNKQIQNKLNDDSSQSRGEDWSGEKNQNYEGVSYLPGSGSNQSEELRWSRKHKDESGDGESDEKDGKRRRRKYGERRDRMVKRSGDEEDWKSDEGKKMRKDKKFAKRDSGKFNKSDNDPVRLTEDGTFGGIKFKIVNRKEIRKSSDSEKDLLLPMKIEKPNEFLSSDDEKPLNYLVKKKKQEVPQERIFDDSEKYGVEIKPDVEDETDDNEVENPLIIETNDENEEVEEKSEEPSVPKHLPKKQQELFLRIQVQNQKLRDEDKKKDESVRERKTSVGSGTGTEEEVGRTPSPEPADENWYSSDDEDNTKKESPLRTVLKSLNAGKKTDNVSTENTLPAPQSPALPKPKIEIPALNGPGLSKINITELLSSIRQVTSKKTQEETIKPPVVPPLTSYEPPKVENLIKINYFNSEPPKREVKDPRLRDPRINPDTKLGITTTRRNSEEKPALGKSIYDSANFKVETQDSDLRFQSKFDSDERIKNLESIVPFGDVDLRNLGGQSEQSDGDFDMRKFGLPFKPVPVHSAATEIDASLNSHPPINYKVETILIPRPDFSSIKVNPTDPQVKRDPRLRRLFRINSSDSEPKEEQKKSGLPSDPRQRKQVVTDTPKSPTEVSFSPQQNDALLGNQALLNTNLLLLAQFGLSAAAAGTNVFDPRVQQLLNKSPQELEVLRNQLSSVKTQSDFDIFRNQLVNNDNPDILRPQGQGLLPTPMGPTGMGILGPAPGFMMPGLTGMPDPSVMMGPMGPMGQTPMGFDPRFGAGGGGGGNEDDMNEGEVRHFNRGFRNDRRGRGNWRGNRDRNWDRDNRRHNKRDERDRNRHNRDRDDRRERKRSSTPD